jgi:hypothetical protein
LSTNIWRWKPWRAQPEGIKGDDDDGEVLADEGALSWILSMR